LIRDGLLDGAFTIGVEPGGSLDGRSVFAAWSEASEFRDAPIGRLLFGFGFGAIVIGGLGGGVSHSILQYDEAKGERQEQQNGVTNQAGR
ncbi:MAG TPA: hypothetical protein DEW46_09440, partial [Verrucomicrobia bacterium]|nr:hypothetical protein [Verrucomicrobiota bacterium]